MTVDILQDVSLTDYYADLLTSRECLSSSIAHTMVSRCAKAAWAQHPRFGGKPKKLTAEMELGTLIDELMLGKGQRIVELQHEAFRSNAAKADRDAVVAQGKIPVKANQLADWKETVERVRKALRFAGVPFDGMTQVCLLWEESATNGNKVQCKALLDHLVMDTLLIQDLKTGTDCSPEALPWKVHRYGYAIQAAAYVRGLEAVLGESSWGHVRFENVWMETSWPHITVRSKMSGRAMMLGNQLWQHAIDKWEECTRTTHWPAYSRPDEVIAVDYPEGGEASVLAMIDEETEADGP